MTESTSPARPVRNGRRPMARFGRVACGAAMVAVLVLGAAAPASAEPHGSMSIDPDGDVDGPPTVTGTFEGALVVLVNEKVVVVDLKVSPTGPTGGSPISQNGCEVASAGGCDGPRITFTWELPALAYNGPYQVEAMGISCDPLLCLAPTAATMTPVEFRLGADPRTPTELRADPGTDRSVLLSWARNPEPDLLYYALFRKDPGGDFKRLGNNIKQPESGRPTFSDTSVAATNGGDFAYRVFAVRKGFSGDDTTTRISKASTDRNTTVAAPPTTVVPGDPSAPPVTTAGEGVDISSFLSGQAPTLPTPGPIFLDLPDTGFGATLPFGSLPDEAEPGEPDAVLPTTARQRKIADFKRNRPLIPVAAGAVLLVLAGHIRLLNVRTKPVAAKKTKQKQPPGTHVARALEAARSDPVPIDVAAVVANGVRHRAPPGDDVARLPVWAEFEPASALGLLDLSGDDDGPGASRTSDRHATREPVAADHNGRPVGASGGVAADLSRQFELFSADGRALPEADDADEVDEFEAYGADEDEAEEEGQFGAEQAEEDEEVGEFEASEGEEGEEDQEDENEVDEVDEDEEDEEVGAEGDEDDEDDEVEVDEVGEFEAYGADDDDDEDGAEEDEAEEFDKAKEFEAYGADEDEADEDEADEDEADEDEADEADENEADDVEADKFAGAEEVEAAPEHDVRVVVPRRARPARAVALAPAEPRFVPEPDFGPEGDLDPILLYAFDADSRWSPAPAPAPESEAEPEPDPQLVYAFDDESQWSAEPEVFVSPRR